MYILSDLKKPMEQGLSPKKTQNLLGMSLVNENALMALRVSCAN